METLPRDLGWRVTDYPSRKPESPAARARADLPPRNTVAVAVRGEAAPEDGRPDSRARIVAKGRGRLADQIVQMAFASGVRVREDADLAEVLEAVDLDSDIPLEAIAAVAEILVYVYRANHLISAGTAKDGTP
ncbi:MAG: EscU/YscU/HrcU family type III secretion system export apparatus switch protein [Alphaproteobacteria bacterium]